MCRLLVPLLAFLLLSCSEKKPKPAPTRTYSVTFGIELLPDTILAEYGGSFSQEKGYDFEGDGSSRLAAHVLKNPGKYPVFQTDGNWTPQVQTGGECRMELDPKAAMAVFSLEENGITVEEFKPAIKVGEENEFSQITCGWSCEWTISVKRPDGDSGRQGGSRGSGAMLVSGRPSMTPLAKIDGKTLWMLVGLKR